MNGIHKALLMLIAMAGIMLAAVGINKAYQGYHTQKWRAERYSRYESAQADALEIKVKISELSRDEEAIKVFLAENVEAFEEIVENPEQIVSADSITAVNISANEVLSSEVSSNDISANDVSGANLSGNELSTDSQVEGTLARMRSGKLTLRERRKLQGSYMETVQVNSSDEKVIASSSIDFSNTKIACLGDSITAAANLEDQENYQQYSYPSKLGEILGAKEVTNLGIGGSSIGRYWDQAFVDRYQAIPADTDIIIVMGGTNDGFCATTDDIGNLEERKPDTFVGDLDELMRGLKANYPDALTIFATPLPNILHDILRKDRTYLLPQENLVDIINQLGEEYQLPVIDLYNSNILDSHDAANIYNFSPDGVHCNPAGYQILAEHFGAEIIKIYEEENNEGIVSAEQ